MTDPIDIVERLAGMSADHGPDGWPAVQMRDITALCEEVRRLRTASAPPSVPQGRKLEPERAELAAALDTSGSVVLINTAGDIVFYAADGKMEIQRRGSECDACLSTNLRLAEAVASAWNEKLQRDAAPIPKR